LRRVAAMLWQENFAMVGRHRQHARRGRSPSVKRRLCYDDAKQKWDSTWRLIPSTFPPGKHCHLFIHAPYVLGRQLLKGKTIGQVTTHGIGENHRAADRLGKTFQPRRDIHRIAYGSKFEALRRANAADNRGASVQTDADLERLLIAADQFLI
jgi:hypothetical protein